HSKRVTFRPIDVKMGPDGAIYIADWYNPIIQHGEVDFRDERRDRTHGRIWRVTAKGRPLVPRIDFTKLSPAELLGHLGSPESYARDMARRELFTRGGEQGRPAVDRWLAALDPQAADFQRLRLEALRLKQGFDRGSVGDVDLPLLQAVLAAPDSRARAAAARVVCDWSNRLESPVELLAPLVDDPAPQVRLEAVRALAVLGGKRAAELALHAVDHGRDTYLDYAVWLAARDLRDAWLPTVVDGTFDDGGKFGRVIYAVRSAEAGAAVPRIVARLQQGGLSAADRAAALDCIATLGSPQDLRLVFDIIVAPATRSAEASILLGHLLEAQQRRRAVPAGDLTAVERLVASSDDACAIRAIAAVAAWQVAAAGDDLTAIATQATRSPAVCAAAIAALGALPGAAPRESLLQLAKPGSASVQTQAAAIAALVPQSQPLAARQAVAVLETARDTAAIDAVYRAFLTVKDGAATLAAALDAAEASLPAAVAKSGLQAISAAGRPEPALAKSLETAVARAAGSTAPQPTGAPRHAMAGAEYDAFVALVRTKADRGRGEAIYNRAALKCVACHRIGDQGARVGPNLTAIGAASPLDYIIDSLVYPAKNVKEGFNTLVVLTTDGQVVAGIPVSRSDAELVLRDATGKEVKVAVAAIDEESPGTSLMPAGLIDGLSREELADLVRYLSELGR
ncbi:MAG: HEAT repeat domain-containing protein, partial [Planctomycetota bacterium]